MRAAAFMKPAAYQADAGWISIIFMEIYQGYKL